ARSSSPYRTKARSTSRKRLPRNKSPKRAPRVAASADTTRPHESRTPTNRWPRRSMRSPRRLTPDWLSAANAAGAPCAALSSVASRTHSRHTPNGRCSSLRSARRSAKPRPGAIPSLEVVAVADRVPGERSPDGGDASLGAAGEDHHREKEAEGEDSDRPPEGRGVAVNCRGVCQVGGVEVTGRVAGDGAGEDRAEQGGADRAADLLGRVDHRRGDPGFASLHAQSRGRERRREDASHSDAEDEQPGKNMAGVAG